MIKNEIILIKMYFCEKKSYFLLKNFFSLSESRIKNVRLGMLKSQ